MNLQQIMERFNTTPTQIKVNEIDERLNFIKLQFQLLNAEKDKLNKKKYKLLDAVNKEGDKVADDLDVEFPEWRMVLVNGLNQLTKQQ
jgi:hypothetical protein